MARGLLDTLHAQDDEGRQLRGGLLNMGIGLLSGSTGHYGQFAPALAQGFAGFQQGQQQVIDDRFKKAQAEQMQALRNMQMQTMTRKQQQEDEAQGLISGGITAQEAARSANPIVREYGQNALNMQYQREKDATTPRMREAIAVGLKPGTPEYAEFISANRSGTTVNIGGDSAPGIGKLSPDYGYVLDPITRQPVIDPMTGLPQAAPVPGSPAAQAQVDATTKAEGAQRQKARAGATVIQDLERALALIPELSAAERNEGIPGGFARTVTSKTPGSVANLITQFTESALSNVGLDTLQTMRDNSPTGGALGQVPIQQQQRLEQVLGSLNINQPPSVLEDNIKRVMNIYTDIVYGDPAERAAAVAAGRMTPQQSAEIDGYYYELSFDHRGKTKEQQQTTQPQQGGYSKYW